MRRIYDVSMLIDTSMPVYKNKPEKRPAFEVTSDFSTGTSHETRIHLDAHTGTHIDAPLHMIPGGATIETISIADLLRPCRVVDLTAVGPALGRAELERAAPAPNEFLLLKTKNSLSDQFDPDFTYVSAEGAAYLAERRVAGVGVDGLGVERGQPAHDTHTILMNAGILIIEGLRLADVVPGVYQMVAAPLRLTGIDAAPARVVLIED